MIASWQSVRIVQALRKSGANRLVLYLNQYRRDWYMRYGSVRLFLLQLRTIVAFGFVQGCLRLLIAVSQPVVDTLTDDMITNRRVFDQKVDGENNGDERDE